MYNTGKNIVIICFSLSGYQEGSRLLKLLNDTGHKADLYHKCTYLPDPIHESLKEWTASQFESRDALIFIGACGICIRSIAPLIVHKKQDPAVLVMDDKAKHVISLLSGHFGGANALTEQVASLMGADPVITTATDLHGRFAVDVFARDNNCTIKNFVMAKAVSAALLGGECVGLYSEFPIEGELPEGLLLCDEKGHPVNADADMPQTGIYIGVHAHPEPFPQTVILIPKTVTLGIGCRKGKDGDTIKQMAMRCLDEAGIYHEALKNIGSLDLKKEEEGIISLSESLAIPFETADAHILKNVEGNFTPSEYVSAVTGVDNVCERSAVYFSNNGKLISRKHGENGVTTALALEDWRIRF